MRVKFALIQSFCIKHINIERELFNIVFFGKDMFQCE